MFRAAEDAAPDETAVIAGAPAPGDTPDAHKPWASTWSRRRATFVSLPLAAVVLVGTTLVVAHGPAEPQMTLVAKVEDGSVSNMVTGKGAVESVNTVNLNFKAANTIHTIDVKIGDKVKKGQKLGEEDDGGLRRAMLQSQQAYAQQVQALNLILNDVNPDGLRKNYERQRDVVDQTRKNIDLKYKADRFVAERSERVVRVDQDLANQSRATLRTCETTVHVPTVPPSDPCLSQKNAYQQAALKVYNDRTTVENNYKNLKVNRGVLRLTYRQQRQSAAVAYNTWNVARVNRPTQILAQRAVVANALVNIANAAGNLANAYIYAPMDGVVSAIAGGVGEYNPGGNTLTPNTPLAPGNSGKIPTVGDLAGNDQKVLTGGQGPNLGLQAVLPGGNTFMQITGVNAYSVVAAFPQNAASQIKSGSQAKVSFDALAGHTADGVVTQIAPSGATGVNGTPVYYASVLLNKDQVPDGLKPGFTANVNVVASTIENKAMVVPSSAVTTDDGQSFVQVPGADGKPVKKQFTAGKRGDDNTEVVSGLKQGDKVLMPSTGPLPVAQGDAPAIPAGQTLNVEQPDPKPMVPLQQAPAAPAVAPSDPAAGGTFPGDPGDLPADADDADASGGASSYTSPGSPGQGTAGVNPFAAPAAAPASPGN